MKRSTFAIAALFLSLLPLLAQAEPKTGVYLNHGNEAEIDAYEKWLGKRVDYIVEFTPDDTWNHITGASPGLGLDWWVKQWDAAYKDRLVISLPMLPKDGTGSLEKGAEGAYDQKWKDVATKLVATGYGNCTLRIGWEFNAGWFKWSAKKNPAAWGKYWKKIVLAMRSVEGANFKFNWCGTIGDQGMDPSAAYPDPDENGDYVDEIGVDIYDQCWNQNTYPLLETDKPMQIDQKRKNAWSNLSEWGKYHLNWWAALAVKKNKPLTIPEWGLAHRPSDNRGGKDNEFFIKKFHEWMNKKQVSWQAYFQNDNNEIHSRLFADDEFPKASAKFIELFGKK